MSDHTTNIEIRWSTDDRPDDVRRRVLNLQRQCLEMWSESTDDQRLAMAVIAQDVLGQLMIDPIKWLPVSAHPVSNSGVEVSFRITFDEIEQTIVELRAESARRITEMRESLIDMRREIDEDPSTAD